MLPLVQDAMRQDRFIRHTDEGVFLDALQIPQWFLDEVSRKGMRRDAPWRSGFDEIE